MADGVAARASTQLLLLGLIGDIGDVLAVNQRPQSVALEILKNQHEGPLVPSARWIRGPLPPPSAPTKPFQLAGRRPDRGRRDASRDQVGPMPQHRNSASPGHGSCEALLDDAAIDDLQPVAESPARAVVDQAARRGKHVLCEKPIGLSSAEAQSLIDARDRYGVAIQEAFMVWTHPQWRRAADICRSGRLGTLQSYIGVFTFRDNPAISLHIAFGGGGLMDIGCH